MSITSSAVATTALKAILARISGDYDAPELKAFGPLRESSTADIALLASEALVNMQEADAAAARKPFTASEAFATLIDGLRNSGSEIRGTNCQVAALLKSGLECLSPDSDAAELDAETLALDLNVICSHLPGDADYDSEDEDEADD